MPERELNLIYARSANYCIGRAGGLPWCLPDDMAFFEETTRNGAIIMGRRTWEDHSSLIPGRTNIVISRRGPDDFTPGILVASDLAAALNHAGAGEPAFVIGGAGLFREAFPSANRVFETIVEAQLEGDTFVEAFDFSDWKTTLLARHQRDARHTHPFRILCHERAADGIVMAGT